MQSSRFPSCLAVELLLFVTRYLFFFCPREQVTLESEMTLYETLPNPLIWGSSMTYTLIEMAEQEKDLRQSATGSELALNRRLRVERFRLVQDFDRFLLDPSQQLCACRDVMDEANHLTSGPDLRAEITVSFIQTN